MAEVQKIPPIDLRKTLMNEGASDFLGINSDGKALILDKNGDQHAIDINQTMKNLGVKDPSKLKYKETNSPNEPLEISPVSLTDRALLDLRGQASNLGQAGAKDSVNYLKKQHEGVTINQNGDMVVKTRGLWHKVDPEFLGNGDAWEMTKEAAGDLAEFSQETIDMAGQSVGAFLGGIVGTVTTANPVGTFIGAKGGAAVGQLAATKIKTVLGKAAGINQASEQETLAENAWETGMALATGLVVPLGVKVGSSVLQAPLKVLSKIGDTAKSAWVNVMSLASGMPAKSMATILQDETSVVKFTKLAQSIEHSAVKVAAGKPMVREFVEEAVEKQTFPKFSQALQVTKRYITQQYGRGLDEIKELPGAVKFDFLQDSLPLVNNLKLIDPLTKLTSTEVGARYSIAPVIAKKAQMLLGEVNLFVKLAPKGKLGVEQALNLKKKINTFVGDNIIGNSDNAGIMQLNQELQPVFQSFNSVMETNFKKIGGEKILGRINEMWAKTEAVRAVASKAANQETGIKTVQSLYRNSLAGKDEFASSVINQMKEFGPNATKNTLNWIDDMHVAKDLATFTPNPGRIQGKGIIGTVLSLGTSPKAVVHGSKSVMAISNAPAKAAAVMNQPLEAMKNFVTQLTPAQRKALLSDDATLSAMFGGILQAPMANEQAVRSLVETGLNQ